MFFVNLPPFSARAKYPKKSQVVRSSKVRESFVRVCVEYLLVGGVLAPCPRGCWPSLYVAPASQVTWAQEQLPEMGKGRFRSSVFRIPTSDSYIDTDTDSMACSPPSAPHPHTGHDLLLIITKLLLGLKSSIMFPDPHKGAVIMIGLYFRLCILVHCTLVQYLSNTCPLNTCPGLIANSGCGINQVASKLINFCSIGFNRISLTARHFPCKGYAIERLEVSI